MRICGGGGALNGIKVYLFGNKVFVNRNKNYYNKRCNQTGLFFNKLTQMHDPQIAQRNCSANDCFPRLHTTALVTSPPDTGETEPPEQHCSAQIVAKAQNFWTK